MTNQQVAEHIADSYLRCVSAGDLEGILALYADDACVEDPVGSEPVKGKKAIAEFYRGALAMNIKAERTGAVRYAAGELVFPFVCHSNAGETSLDIEVIDHFTLNPDNLVVTMRAFWSEANMHQKA